MRQQASSRRSSAFSASSATARANRATDVDWVSTANSLVKNRKRWRMNATCWPGAGIRGVCRSIDEVLTCQKSITYTSSEGIMNNMKICRLGLAVALCLGGLMGCTSASAPDEAPIGEVSQELNRCGVGGSCG